jgi:hypothetical protein
MSDLGLIILALVFGFLFFGPHTKAKDKDKGDKEGKK